MRLGIDLDGVVCDFPSHANLHLASQLGVDPIEVTKWDWYKDYGEGVQSHWDRLWEELVPDGFFGDVEAFEDALPCLDYLRGRGHSLVFITARPASAAISTEEWLERHGFGGHHLLLAMSSKAKQFTDTDLLLDDKGDTVLRHVSHGKSAVLFKRPWNTEWWRRVPSVSGWMEFVELVDFLEDSR